MTYIWNRADRVDPKLMPEVVENAFNKWTKEQYKNLIVYSVVNKILNNHNYLYLI